MKAWIDKHLKFLFILPILLFIAFMVVYPLAYTFRMSFYSYSMSAVKPPKFVGLKNYITMFTDTKFSNACKLTLIFSAGCLVFQTVLGLALALFLNREFRLRGLSRTLSLLPVVATPVAIAMVWKMMYDPALGILNMIITSLGYDPVAFLGNPVTALPSLMAIEIWENTPQVMLICMGGLAGIPTDSIEAAKIDGASDWQVLKKITLPLLSPTLLAAVTLRLIDVMKAYDIIYSTTQGGPGISTQTINVLAYRQAFENFRFGDASATVTVFVIVLVIVTLLFNIIRKRTVVEY